MVNVNAMNTPVIQYPVQPFEPKSPGIGNALQQAAQTRNINSEIENRNALAPYQQASMQASTQANQNYNALTQAQIGQISNPNSLQNKKAKLEMEKAQREHEKMIVDKYGNIAQGLQSKYDELKKKYGEDRAAVEMQPYWDPWKQKARQDGIQVTDIFDPVSNSQFIDQAKKSLEEYRKAMSDAALIKAGTTQQNADTNQKKVEKGPKKTAVQEADEQARQAWITQNEIDITPEQWQLAKIRSKSKYSEGIDSELQTILAGKPETPPPTPEKKSWFDNLFGGSKKATPATNEQPPIPGAQKAPDGKWYVQQNGKYFLVQ